MSRAILIIPKLQRVVYVPLPPERPVQTFLRYLRVHCVNTAYLDGLGIDHSADELFTICTASAQRSAVALSQGDFSFSGFKITGRALIARSDGRRLLSPAVTPFDLPISFY